ncbi:glycine--tRNA ligase subunit beta [Falsiroseomonas sp. CW058]|uniref:glycine--tRNA ligase subunit beta n=1 Tax=Falsiroseomonas sp. CW058 TaxID=3388664 RepID=UPI003D3183D3
MPEFLLELFSEEIPARMQARGADDLCRAFAAAAAPVLEGAPRGFHGPRRIGLVATLRAGVTTEGKEERGPRSSAPPAALEGFLRKHGATRDRLEEQGGFWVLRKPGETIAARDLLARTLPGLVRGFGWPKSMRWNGPFTWVRPLHRILAILDGEVVPFAIEDLPGLLSGNETEGHRIMAPGAFAVRSAAEHEAGLRQRRVILDAAERAKAIEDGLAELAAAKGVSIVPDRGLLEEVAGLVEWPVPLLGRIDDAFMDLPPEVMRTTMRVNQRYFALVTPDGSAAPYFGVVANIAATDGGATLVAGNERVLRARLSDARFFWDADRRQALEDFLPKLDGVVFHAKLGTQGQRVARLERLARWIAPQVGADPDLAARAARLAKADLASGMVGEFPELQGVMGRYYARHGGEDPRVADAIGTQYKPLGPGDAVPAEPVGIAVALADKIDTLAGFFAVDERPTGSGDPFALRRAALGVIRIVRENRLRLRLSDAFAEAFFGFPQAVGVTPEPEFGMAVAQDVMKTGWQAPRGGAHPPMVAAFAAGLVDFLAERLRVQLRAEGARHDVVSAAFGAGGGDDLLRLLARADALKALVESETGTNLLAAYKRAQNILRIEEKKDGPHAGAVDPALLAATEEVALAAALGTAEPAAAAALAREDHGAAMSALAALRAPVDAFFDRVTVNDPAPELRRNRLRLLARLRTAMDAVADFSRIEG